MKNKKELRGYSNAYNAYRNLMNEVSELKRGELDVLLSELNNTVKRDRAVSRLVEGHLPLVRTISFRMAWWLKCDAVLDVFEDASMALIEAVGKYDASCGEDFISYISIEVQNRIKKSIGMYTSVVYRPENAVDEYGGFDVSLDECVEDEDGLTRADMLVGDIKTGRGLQRRSTRARVMNIIRGVLDEERADVMLKLLGFCGHWYTENMVADEKGLTVTRILQMKREAIDKLIDCAYFSYLKSALVGEA